MISQRKAMDAGKRPSVHEGHAAPLVQVLTWLFLAFSSLSIIALFATRKALSRPSTKADIVLLAVFLLSVSQTVAFLCPAGQLIGNSQNGLSEDIVMQAWKALYCEEILSLLTIVAAKSSLLVPLMDITPVVNHRTMTRVACAVIVLWGISGVLMIAFQCPSPERWDITSPHCMDIRAVRTYNAVMNIVTDLALTTIPTLMILPLQISSDKRLTLLTGVWSRLLVMTASGIQIAYIRALQVNDDLLNSIWKVVVCGQVVQVMSVMTSIVPFLKPFLLSLESGFLSASKPTHSTVSGYGSTANTGHPLSYIQIGNQKIESASKTSSIGL